MLNLTKLVTVEEKKCSETNIANPSESTPPRESHNLKQTFDGNIKICICSYRIGMRKSAYYIMLDRMWDKNI